jgi:predicted nuclease of predicted toxin-antitoxin system
MKFIVDAQLIQNAGYDAIYTLDLPQRNNTPNSNINTLSINEERIVILLLFFFFVQLSILH